MRQYKDILIQNLFEKYKQAIEDAKFALDENRFETAQNRIYYAIFYIVSALAYLKAFSTSKHSQLLGWFNKTFIKEGIFDKELAITYKDAFEYRMKSDYEFTYKPTGEKVKALYDEAEKFIKIIQDYIDKNF